METKYMARKLFYIIILFVFIFNLISYQAVTEADDEEVILTTYYPAPHGNYNNLQADTLTIGRGTPAAADQVGVVGFTPRVRPSSPQTGDLYFDNGASGSVAAGLYFKDASGWRSAISSSETKVMAQQVNLAVNSLSTGVQPVIDFAQVTITISSDSGEDVAIFYSPSVAINMHVGSAISVQATLYVGGDAKSTCQMRHLSTWYSNTCNLSWTGHLAKGTHNIKIEASGTGDGSFTSNGAVLVLRNVSSIS